MQVKKSEYLEKIRPTAKKLVKLLCEKYDYCSLLGIDSEDTRYRVASAGINISPVPFLNNRGFVIRVFDKSGQAEYSFNELSEELIPQIAENVEKAVSLYKGENKGLPEDRPLTLDKSSDFEIDPKEMGDEKIIARLTELREKGLKKDERIIDCVTMFEYRRYSNIFISRNRDLTQNLMWTNGVTAAVAKNGEKIEQGFKSCSLLGGAELLEQLEKCMDAAAAEALELLSASPMVPGTYDCICEPEVTGMIVHGRSVTELKWTCSQKTAPLPSII